MHDCAWLLHRPPPPLFRVLLPRPSRARFKSFQTTRLSQSPSARGSLVYPLRRDGACGSAANFLNRSSCRRIVKPGSAATSTVGSRRAWRRWHAGQSEVKSQWRRRRSHGCLELVIAATPASQSTVLRVSLRATCASCHQLFEPVTLQQRTCRPSCARAWREAHQRDARGRFSAETSGLFEGR